MKSSMADYLRVTAPHLFPTLISQTALSHIQELAQNLPSISVAAFECRLDHQSRVDFSICSSCISFQIPEFFLIAPVWKDFADFVQDWIIPDSELGKIINYVWLEFDLISQPSQVPIPCIAFTLNLKTAGDIKLRNIAIQQTIKQLNSCDASSVESKIQNCLDLLPNKARIAHIGAMLSRQDKTVRLVIKGIPSQQLPDYLAQIGWQDPTNQLTPLISNLSNFIDSIALAFDVGVQEGTRRARIYPSIGLECFVDEQSLLKPLIWQSFLDDYLVKKELCIPEKRNALLAWSGFSKKVDHQELWPDNLNLLDNLLSANAYSVFCRTLNHIKIVYQSGYPLSAKAYLFFEHLYLKYDQ